MIQKVRLTNSRGDIALSASSRELDPSAEFWVDGTPTGWVGGFSMRGENEERLGHGSFPTKRFRSARALEVRARVALDSWDHANFVKRQLSAALGDGEAGELTVTEDGVPDLTAVVERTGEVLIARTSPTAFTVSIPLTAPNPELHGAWRESTVQPVGAGVGFEFVPFASSGVIAFGSAVSTDEWVWNEGNAPSAPVFEVTADAPGGFSVGLGTKRVTYPWPTFPDIPVVVDMAGAVTVGGVDQSHLLGERGWSTVPPRGIETPTFAFLQGGTGWAVVRHRDTYI